MRARNPLFVQGVHDMDRAKAFYTEVFEVEPYFESPGWTTLEFGSFRLALHLLPTEQAAAPRPTGLNLEVDKIEDLQTDIERLGGRLRELIEPSGVVPVRLGCFTDSEGNGFELRQQPQR